MDEERINPEGEDNGQPSQQSLDNLYATMKGWFIPDQQHSDDWRQDAQKAFDFVANDQWDPKTAQQMTGENRVPITFNQTAPFISAVAGIEINTRQEIVFLPRGTEEGDVIANESLSAASEWMGQQCGAQQEESQAFQDMLTCGMGWTEDRLDYELESDGKYIEQALPPLEMYWDHAARQQNLKDSRRIWRARKMSLDDARAMFATDADGQDVSDEDLNCSWATGIDGNKIKPIEERRLKLGAGRSGDGSSEVIILQVQWWERETYHRVANPFTGELEDLDKDGLKALREKAAAMAETGVDIPDVSSVEMQRRVYKQAFVGGKILKVGSCPRDDGFTLHCMTGKQHVTKGTWYGLVKMLHDPQMMANKWLTQATHVINTTAKGGILAEEDAFVDIREAQEKYARPDAITFVKKGAIKDGKIMQKPGTGMAAPYVQLLQFAIDSFARVTGINMELLGMRDVNQPGVLEAHRKQAAMTILATLFDSLTAFRLEVGRTRLCFIQNYIADGRLIRVLGENGYRAIKLMKDKTVGEYDVIVSEAPTSPNQKEQTWVALQSVLPAFKGMITPEIAVMLLDYVPGIPQQLVDSLKNVMKAQQASPQAAAAAQLEHDGQQAKVDRDKAAAQKDQAQAQKLMAETVLQAAGSASENNLNDARAQRERALATHSRVRSVRDLSPEANSVFYPTVDGAQLPHLPQLPTGPVIDGTIETQPPTNGGYPSIDAIPDAGI